MMAGRLPPEKYPGETVGSVAGEDGTKVLWFCDDLDDCRFFVQFDMQKAIESVGPDVPIDDLVSDDFSCSKCGGYGHLRIMRKPDPVKERQAGLWAIGGLLAGAAFMAFGAFYNFEQMTSGNRFRPFQLIVCLPMAFALVYFAWEVWKGMRKDQRSLDG